MNNEAILQYIEEKFSTIQQDENLEQLQKDIHTANLMTLLEDYLHVPILDSDESTAYQNSHPNIMELYEKLSSSRKSL